MKLNSSNKTLVSGLLLGLCTQAAPAQVPLGLPSQIKEKPRDSFIHIQPEDLGSHPRQQILNTVLRMPGFGLDSSTDQMTNRLKYAREHKWLEDDELDGYSGELKVLVERVKEVSQNTSGHAPVERRRISNAIYKLNERFEEAVLAPELSVSGTVLWKKQEQRQSLMTGRSSRRGILRLEN